MSVKLSKGAPSNRGKSAMSAAKCQCKVKVASECNSRNWLSTETEETEKFVALWGPTRPNLTVRMTCIGF